MAVRNEKLSGAKPPLGSPALAAFIKSGSPLVWAALVGVGGLGLVVVTLIRMALPSEPAPPAPAVAEAPAKPVSPWVYSEAKDKIADGVARTACTPSLNAAALQDTGGDVHAELCLETSPREGLKAYVRLKGEGQILCNPYDGCALAARFDKRPPESFEAKPAEDGSPGQVFIPDAPKLLETIKGAKAAVIEVPFYQGGKQQIEFDVSGLEWSKGREAAPANTAPPEPAKLSALPGFQRAAYIADPPWIAQPSRQDIARWYPEPALSDKVAGEALLQCSVSRTGQVGHCAVASEEPAGQGFGDAALKLSRLYRLFPGEGTRDAVVQVHIVFRPQDVEGR